MFSSDNSGPKRKMLNGRWTPEEHQMFIKGLETYGKDWKSMHLLIPARTLVQIRSHAQKYFKKLSKNAFSTPEESITPIPALSLQTSDMRASQKLPHSRLFDSIETSSSFSSYPRAGVENRAPTNMDRRYSLSTQSCNTASYFTDTTTSANTQSEYTNKFFLLNSVDRRRLSEISNTSSFTPLVYPQNVFGRNTKGQNNQSQPYLKRKLVPNEATEVGLQTLAAATILTSLNMDKRQKLDSCVANKLSWASAVLSQV